MATITEEIAKDHAQIKSFYKEFETYYSAANWIEAKKWYNQLAWEVARHSVSEEVILYPWMEKHTKLDMAANKKAHQTVKEKFSTLESMKIDDPDFKPILASVMKDLITHMDDEEQNDFREILRAGSAEDLADLARSFERRKKIVPTHPHPNAPTNATLESLAGLLIAPFDKLSDMFKSWPSEEQVRAAVKQA